jgi:L-cysteine:1D-myo-inositol 2-amino-2-deoxy-alpha-D-glucopyranoside ligase
MCAAQAHLLTGKELAASYVHTGMIGLDGEKMSKSKGNLVFVSRLVAAGTDPMAIRLALMSDHYRHDRMWSQGLLKQAENQLAQIRKALEAPNAAPTDIVIHKIIEALSDDLNTPKALSILADWSSSTLNGETGGNASELRDALDSLLGLLL